jgi:hypothetical protein
MDAQIAERVYQIFQYNPDALKRIRRISPSAFHKLTKEAFDDLKEEVQQIQRDFAQLEEFLEV